MKAKYREVSTDYPFDIYVILSKAEASFRRDIKNGDICYYEGGLVIWDTEDCYTHKGWIYVDNKPRIPINQITSIEKLDKKEKN